MSHGPGFGNSCIRRFVSSNRWPGSPWLLRICLGLYYIALSKEICHRKTVKGSFSPSPGEGCGSTLSLCSQSLLSRPPSRAHGMFGRGPALWHSLQTVRGGSLRPLACESWQNKSQSMAPVQPLCSLWGEESRVGNNFWSGQRCMAHSPACTGGWWDAIIPVGLGVNPL